MRSTLNDLLDKLRSVVTWCVRIYVSFSPRTIYMVHSKNTHALVLVFIANNFFKTKQHRFV